MTSKNVFVILGISGSGKSTLCSLFVNEKEKEGAAFLDFSRFSLAWLERKLGADVSLERMRELLSDIDTYVMCVSAFREVVEGSESELILVASGGFLSPVASGFQCSSFHFWEVLSPTSLIVVLAEPLSIRERSLSDTSKKRSVCEMPLQEIGLQQNVLISLASSLAINKGIPIGFVLNNNLDDALVGFSETIRRAKLELSAGIRSRVCS